MFKYIIITPFKQSATKVTDESNGYIVDDTNVRDNIKSEGDVIEVADTGLRL